LICGPVIAGMKKVFYPDLVKSFAFIGQALICPAHFLTIVKNSAWKSLG
jgi:hypothetical protein